MRKTAILAVLLLTVLAAGLWWTRSRRGKGNPGPATARVERRDFSSSVLATGAVRAQIGAEVRVGARISGKVVQLLANIGDVVAKDQVIAELEKADLEATVCGREAELADARAQLETERAGGPLRIRHGEALVKQAEADRNVAEVKLVSTRREGKAVREEAEPEVDRWTATRALAETGLKRRQLLRKAEALAQQSLDEAQEQFSTADARLRTARKRLALATVRDEDNTRQAEHALPRADAAVDAARRALDLERTTHEQKLQQILARIARSEATVRHARVQLSYATITAPISGIIASVATQEGETVAAGLNAPTFVTIIDLERLQVDAFVDEVDIGKVHPGQKAVFTVDAFPAREFEGRVTAIYPKAVIQENVVNYDVVVEISSDYDGLLRPEMTASVTILLERREAVLALPGAAVKRVRGRNVVHVPSGSSIEEREIKVGWRDAGWIEVVGGLQEGETVLLDAPAVKTNEP